MGPGGPQFGGGPFYLDTGTFTDLQRPCAPQQASFSATIHQLLCGLLRHMREVSQDCPNFLDKKTLNSNIFTAPWMHISTICTLMALVGKSNMQRCLRRKMKRSCGRVEYWAQTLQDVFRMQRSLQLGRCSACVEVKNIGL